MKIIKIEYCSFMKNLTMIATLFFSTTIYASRLFVEYEEIKYVAFNADLSYQTHNLKKNLIKNRVKGITYLVYGQDQRELDIFKKLVSGLFESDNEFNSTIKLLLIKTIGEAKWPQDSFPNLRIDGKKLTFIDSDYYEGFEPDQFISNYFDIQKIHSKATFETGNLVTNRKGDCYTVKEVFSDQMSDEVFSQAFSCKSITRLKHKFGIGHADEVLKFISDNVVLTQDETLVKSLEDKGYKVYLLPKAPMPGRGVMPQRSYVNSLLINGIAYVPTFQNKKLDNKAISVYKKAGLKAIPVDATYISDYGGGALHCLTKTYPDFSLFK